MRRPYVGDGKYTVHVVWHHDKHVEFNIGEVTWNCLPTLTDKRTDLVQMNTLVDRLTQQTVALAVQTVTKYAPA